jgi:carbonic anhydrase
MAKFTDDAVAEIIVGRSGEDVADLAFFTFRDLDQSVRDDVDRIRSLSQIPADATVSGHVYDVRTGTLREVAPAEQSIGRDAPFSRSLGARAANAARAPP